MFGGDIAGAGVYVILKRFSRFFVLFRLERVEVDEEKIKFFSLL